MVLATAVKKKWRQWWWWQASSSSRSDEKNVADKTDRTNSSGSSNKRSGAWAVLHTCFATAYAALPSSCRLSLPLWSNPPSPLLPPSFSLFLPHPPWLDRHQQLHRCRFYSYQVSSQLHVQQGDSCVIHFLYKFFTLNFEWSICVRVNKYLNHHQNITKQT